MFCVRCGMELKEDQKVCIRCGTVNKIDETVIIQKKKKKYKRSKITFFILLIIIIGCAFIFFKYKNYKIEEKITPIEELKQNYNSIHYINNLYISDGHHFNYLLDDYQKKIYLDILDAVKNFETEITIDTSKITAKYPNEYLMTVFDSLNMDHPELIQLGEITTKKNYVNTKVLKINYVLNNTELEKAISEIQEKINLIKINTNDYSEYDKAKYIYDYLSKSNTYDELNNLTSLSAYSAFTDKYSPNYLGYSKASQILLQNTGVNSIMTIGSNGSKIHAWNLIKLNKNYYYFDLSSSVYNNSDLRFAGFLKNSRNYGYIYKSVIPTIKNKY